MTRPVPLETALETIRAAFGAAGGAIGVADGVERCDPEAALGRMLAAAVMAPRALPPFDNSAYDGYALAAGSRPRFTVMGEATAGLPWTGQLRPDEAVRIATGARLPAGAVSVVPQELAQRLGDTVLVRDGMPPEGAHIRRAGEDVAQGAVALEAGTRVGQAALALLVQLGVAEIPVRPRLRVALLASGSELQAGAPDSNTPMLAAWLARDAVRLQRGGTLPDARQPTLDCLQALAGEVDLVITTGGVSVGPHDHVRPALETLGEVLVPGVAVRPGRPVTIGRLGATAVLALPGNPVAAFVTFALLGRPLLRALAGEPWRTPPRLTARVEGRYAKPAGLRAYPRARLEGDSAVLHPGHGSDLLSSLSWADALVEVPEATTAIATGDTVTVLPFAGLLA